ncbi:MAG: Rid family detoxifying hydrolase [Defluviitaleaceae bacterium]|nr:Rid family detoxifying hydrolase [Defluviitaleaceae bacterium]
MSKINISTDKAPTAIGPYVQGVSYGDLIFTSGQLPICPNTGVVEGGCIKKATRCVLNNVQAVLAASGSGLDKVIKATVLLKDLGNFAQMNEVYWEFFGDNPPARTCFEVSKLLLDAIVEIEVVAFK